MRLRHQSAIGLILAALVVSTACGEGGEATTDANAAGPSYKIQGEYKGQLQLDGKSTPVGVQVIDTSYDPNNQFEAVLYVGGLPGDGWKRGDKREKVKGKADGGVTAFKADKWTAKVDGGKLVFANSGGDALGSLEKTERKSPTLGAKPPEGAVVLFDGSNADQWHNGKMTDDHLLIAGASSKPEFQDYTLHIEFRTPYMPRSTGQGRGNSGVYQQNRYEVQVLDSFGLEGENNECGGLYSVQAPAVNMCLPPLSWQTYDIDFTGARFDDNKQKTKNARMTIKHNGVAIYEDFEMPTLTPGGAGQEYPGKGPFQLQWHGNPVNYRNIWVVEKK